MVVDAGVGDVVVGGLEVVVVSEVGVLSVGSGVELEVVASVADGVVEEERTSGGAAFSADWSGAGAASS
ncbi:hypothetical protein [Actinophytocola sp. KF-1]